MAKRGRKTTGFIKKRGDRYAAVVTFTDELGRRKSKERLAPDRGKANDILADLLKELKTNKKKAFQGEVLTISDLCEYFRTNYAIPAQVQNGIKTEGLKSWQSVGYYLDAVKSVLGKKKLQESTDENIRQFRRERLATKTVRDKKRSLSSVHRELSYLRRMLNIAEEKGWIYKSCFPRDIIKPKAENKRNRIISKAEEMALLDACSTLPKTGHLRPILILLFDLGLRRKEVLEARWRDVDFVNETFRVRETVSKVEENYLLALSKRAKAALKEVFDNAKDQSADARVFNFKEVKKSWQTVREHCGLSDVWLRDSRRTSASRLAEAGVPIPLISLQLGHKTTDMTSHYLGLSPEAARATADAMNAWTEKAEAAAKAEKKKAKKEAKVRHVQKSSNQGIIEVSTVA